MPTDEGRADTLRGEVEALCREFRRTVVPGPLAAAEKLEAILRRYPAPGDDAINAAYLRGVKAGKEGSCVTGN